MKIFASDLDNTLIYSYKKIKGDCICVEMKGNKELSYMTKSAYNLIETINKKFNFIPVTTRSVKQYRRINILQNGIHIALASNGGTLLIDNEINEQWKEETKKIVEPCYDNLRKAAEILKKDKNVYFEIRIIDDIFLYTKTKNFKMTKNSIEENIETKNIFIDRNADKFYIFPNGINKGNAIRRLKKFLGQNDIVIAAGDSLFDVSMLNYADIAFIPENLENKIFTDKIYKFEGDRIYFADFIFNKLLKL